MFPYKPSSYWGTPSHLSKPPVWANEHLSVFKPRNQGSKGHVIDGRIPQQGLCWCCGDSQHKRWKPQKDAEKSDFQNCFKSGKLNRFASIVSSGYLLILAKMISLWPSMTSVLRNTRNIAKCTNAEPKSVWRYSSSTTLKVQPKYGTESNPIHIHNPIASRLLQILVLHPLIHNLAICAMVKLHGWQMVYGHPSQIREYKHNGCMNHYWWPSPSMGKQPISWLWHLWTTLQEARLSHHEPRKWRWTTFTCKLFFFWWLPTTVIYRLFHFKRIGMQKSPGLSLWLLRSWQLGIGCKFHPWLKYKVKLGLIKPSIVRLGVCAANSHKFLV